MPNKLTLQEMRKIAKMRGGRCLSKKYTDNLTKLKWQCSKQHIWHAIPSNIKRGQWCPICGHEKAIQQQKLTIEEMQKYAKSRGGKCLSNKYINARTKLKWKCRKGHVWLAIPESIKRGTWCPKCGKEKLSNLYILSIQDLHRTAREKGGKFLSKKYINANTPVKWMCGKGHVWNATAGSVRAGSWCPVCAYGKAGDWRRLSLKDVKRLAKLNKGKCLSRSYVNSVTKLKWQCKRGHVWYASTYSIKNGSWCPTCSQGRNERLCRRFFERIFGEAFPKVKPRWLVNAKGNLMELDGYSSRLGLAFEYHGGQHYKDIPMFTKKMSFWRRVTSDKLKRVLCRRHGVVLIEVPHSIEVEHLEDFIVNQCKRRGIEVPSRSRSIRYKLFDLYSDEFLKKMRLIARSRKGICLSKQYINSSTKLKWKCEFGHIWLAMPNNIQQGQWCPICSHRVPLTLSEMRRLALLKGGKCLSKRYITANTKLKWICKEGHVWMSKPAHVKDGHWCRKCASLVNSENKKLTLDEMQKIAMAQGGRCLSKQYINNRTKLKWKCKMGHVWEAMPVDVKQGTWCRVCAYKEKGLKRRLTIEEMQKIARSKGGRCLSKQYINAHAKLKWKCKLGHVWEAAPDKIKQGEWCPYCYGHIKKTIESMNKLAKKMSGLCLSRKYINSNTRLRWQCKKGHKWKATPSSIRMGHWCPKCAIECRTKGTSGR